MKISYAKDKKFNISILVIMLLFWFSASMGMAAGIPNNPILYRETGGSRAYLHELEFPVGSTTKTTTGAGRNYWNKVRVNFDQIIPWSIPTTDLTSVGIYIPIRAGTTHAVFGQAVYADANAWAIPADANISTKMPCIGLLAESGSGAGKKMLIKGLMRNNAWGWTVGRPIYVRSDPNTTSGLSQTAPTIAGNYGYKQAVGWAIDPNVIVFTDTQTLIH